MKLPYINYPLIISKRRITFMPKGKIAVNPVVQKPCHGVSNNPIKDDYIAYGASIVSRLFVGLSDTKGRKYKIDDLIAFTRAFLKNAGFPQDSSFLSQRGVYTHKTGAAAGRTVKEDSAIVVIIKTDPKISARRFEGMTVKLAEYLCENMRQESIIIDLQRNGVSKHIYEVVP